MTRAQHAVLESADKHGVIRLRDGRVLKALAKKGWAEQVQDKKSRARKPRYVWYITAAGQHAWAWAEVIEPKPKPDWRDWKVGTEVIVPRRHYRVRHHTVIQPWPGMLWRVFCPRDGEGIRLEKQGENLAEALDLLADHLYRRCQYQPVSYEGLERNQK
ncbi:hypothetical protein [Amycolatopsis anabasis]|uniref:hypothetical protein n=1 Tax=Amycolatopsis anabasis TaxID=1840409 RepID=UPI00131AB57B|nr:hypothetical protein [Amycolatopsis anabasis]